MKIKRKTYSLILLTSLISGCYFDNAEDLYPDFPGDCDPTEASYQANIRPIIQQYCYACHNSGNATALGAGINLEVSTSLTNYVENGSFLGSIEHASGYSAMPKGGGKLTECEITTIKTWIQNGSIVN